MSDHGYRNIEVQFTSDANLPMRVQGLIATDSLNSGKKQALGERDHTEVMHHLGGGWQKANELCIVRAVSGEVIGELEIGPQHRQSYGIVHGGVHCAVIETLASIGAAIDAAAQGKAVVGLENNTSFIRAVRSGTLRGVARPMTRGRRSHVWEASIHDDQGRLVATGRVRLLVIDPEADLAEKPVDVRGAGEAPQGSSGDGAASYSPTG